MQFMKRISPIAAVLVLSMPVLRAQAGHWEGSVQAPSAEVKVELDLAKDSKGGWYGTMGNPTQNLKGLPLATVTAEGRAVHLQVGKVQGERVFEAEISADGKSMSGVFGQLGIAMPFTLTRTGEAKLDPPARIAPVSKELEGAWNGTMELQGKQLQFLLTMSNQPDGTAKGTLVSYDDGLEIPLTGIAQNGTGVTLDLKGVGGSFSGALKAENMELAGTYSQGPLTAPLTFGRAPEGKK